MLTVEHYARIRRAHRDGMSIRATARHFGHSRRTVRQALAQPEPQPYTRHKDPPAPKLGPYKAVIEQILRDDQDAPRKQRHTAVKVFERIRHEHGYTGGYDQVRRYIQRHRKANKETFIPLVHGPGQRLEADFGHVYVDFPDGRRQIPVLMVTWSFSAYPFAIALPTERIEAVLHGLVEALTFFGAVPQQLWWDNPKTVATAILSGRQRRVHPRYQALASHYCFEPRFCMPAQPQEKPYVENSVYRLQRDWCTPVPKVRDLDQFNQYLRQCCQRRRQQCICGQSQTIGERFAQDRAAAASLPKTLFDPCLCQEARVDKYQLVRFDNNRYSVPRRWAFETVTVKAYVDHITFVSQGTVIASHRRCYLRGQQILEPLHYLAILGRRPAALDHSNVFGRWQLPSCFEELRRDLEAREGPRAGTRQYIRVLQLLAYHPAQRVQQAIEHCRRHACLNVDRILQQTYRLAAQPQKPNLTEPKAYPQVQVPKPDLNCFDQLLTHSTSGDLCHVGT